MGTRRKYTKEFKEEAVGLSESSGNKSQVAHDLGIHMSMLRRWKLELQQEEKKAFSGKGKPRDEEMVQLKRENRRLQEEVEILKKAVGIFSIHPR